MTEEDIKAITESIQHTRKILDDIESMISDYEVCKSETSKKYIGAAVMKLAAAYKMAKAN